MPMLQPPIDASASPELSDRPRRRTFTARDKIRILAETDRAAETGGIGAILRREGVYSSSLTEWRKQRDAGAFGALAPAKRGPKAVEANPLAAKLALAQRDNARLTLRLKRAEAIIELQKPACGGRNGSRYVIPRGERPDSFWWTCPRQKTWPMSRCGLADGDAFERSRLGN